MPLSSSRQASKGRDMLARRPTPAPVQLLELHTDVEVGVGGLRATQPSHPQRLVRDDGLPVLYQQHQERERQSHGVAHQRQRGSGLQALLHAARLWHMFTFDTAEEQASRECGVGPCMCLRMRARAR